MEPGFFLKLADNTGDSFAYEILPGKEYKDIPLRRNPTVLVRCIVRERDYGDNNVPTYRKDPVNLEVLNSNGKPVPMPDLEKQETTGTAPLFTNNDSISVTSPKGVSEAKVKSLQSTSGDSSRLVDLELDVSTIVDNPKLDEDGHVALDKSGPDDPVDSAGSTPEERSLNGRVNEEPLGPEGRLVSPDSDDESCVDTGNNETDFESLVADLHNQFDEEDESDSILRFDKITAHRYLNGILELQIRYPDDETSWVSLEQAKNDQPRKVAHYVLSADLGKVSNGIHRRWARAFLRSMRRFVRRMKKVDYRGFVSSQHDPFPCSLSVNRLKCVRRATRKVSKHPRPRKTKVYKYDLEVQLYNRAFLSNSVFGEGKYD